MNRWGMLAWSGSLAGIGVAVLAWMVPGNTPVRAGAVVLFACCMYPVMRACLMRDGIDWFAPVYPVTAYFAAQMLFRGIYDLYVPTIWLERYDPWSERFYGLMAKVFFVSAVALICLYFGYYCRVGNAVAASVPKVRIRITARHVNRAGVVSFMIGLVGICAFVKSTGLGWELVEQPGLQLERAILVGGMLYYDLFMRFLPAGLLAVTVALASGNATGLTRLIVGLLLLGNGAYFLVVAMKGAVIIPIIYLIVVMWYLCRRRFRSVFLGSMIALVIAFPVIFSFRATGASAEIGKRYIEYIGDPELLGRAIAEPFVSRFFGADMLALIIDETSADQYQWGNTLAKLATAWVPRKLWPDKPWSFGKDFLTLYLSHVDILAVISPSLVGEWYINGNIAGVIIGFTSLGLVMKVAYQYLVSRCAGPGRMLVYPVLLVFFILIIDGPVVDHLVFLGIQLTSIVAIGHILGMRVVRSSMGKRYESSRD